MLLRQWYESLLQSMSWPNQGEKTDDRADKRRVIRPQQGMQIFVKVMTGRTITLTVTRDTRIEARQFAAGTHDRVEMAAEREVERDVERETRQPAASAELETCGGTGGQPCLSVGAVTGAGVRPVHQVMNTEEMAAVPMETAPMASAPTGAASMEMVSVEGIDGSSQLVNVEGSVGSHGEI